MKNNFHGQLRNQRGFTLFIALVIMASLLLIAAGVINLAVRQSLISNAGKESQLAFYAADTGMECALYWDIGNPSGSSAFATSTGATLISCNGQNSWVGGSATSTFSLEELQPANSCAEVTVEKFDSFTRIESKGYNTCDSDNPRRVERAVRARY